MRCADSRRPGARARTSTTPRRSRSVPKGRTRSSRKAQRRARPRPTGARDLFEGRFSEILIIFVLALIVLGPEKLPRVVGELGRWVGRARAMARQFREQLEEEVQLEEARKAQRAAPPPPPPRPPPPPHRSPQPRRPPRTRRPPTPPPPPAPMSEEPEALAEGTLISHLLELRDRLLRSLVAVGLAFMPCVYYSNDLFTFISRPLLAKLPQGSNLIATGVMSPFTTPFKLSFFAALMIAMPYVIYQLWAFVAPGLYRGERRFPVPLLVSSILLFYVGIGFAYYFVFPVMFEFFTHTTPKGVSMMTDINNYLDFVLTMFFCFGLAFEVPVAVVLLVVMGLVRIEKLQKNRCYFLIVIFILAALLTPPDAISHFSLAIPMYFLYEGGILMARILSRGKSAAAAANTGESES